MRRHLVYTWSDTCHCGAGESERILGVHKCGSCRDGKFLYSCQNCGNNQRVYYPDDPCHDCGSMNLEKKDIFYCMSTEDPYGESCFETMICRKCDRMWKKDKLVPIS